MLRLRSPRPFLALLGFWAAVMQPAAQTAAPDVSRILGSAGFREAKAFIRADYDRFVKELIALTEIPAPPFKEERRAAAYLAMLQQHGLSDVERDQEGNVMAVRRGTGGGPMLAVLAHLDTVFPEGTDVKVRREGTRLMAPGIGDDTRALALMLSHNGLSQQTLLTVAYSLPALAAGVTLGIVLFRRVNDAWFRSLVLAVLLFAGLALVV